MLIFCPRNVIVTLLLWLLWKLDTIFVGSISISHFYQSTPDYIDNQIHYEYRYWIEDTESGVVSERWETRLGDYVKGRYSFVEPGGLVRTVNYEVDGGNGYRAIVHTGKPGAEYLSRRQFLSSQQSLLPS